MNAIEPDTIQRAWPKSEQPMARLLSLGPVALTDAEIVSVLLRKGRKDTPAVEVARELLGRAGGIGGLLAGSTPSLIAPEARARLSASIELARRALLEEIRSGSALTSPAAVRDYLKLRLAGLEHEVFLVVMVDAQHRVLVAEELFRGTLTQTSVHPREIVKAALRANAAAVIFAHNHPSGVAQPSQADEMLTRQLREALALIEVRVLDHMIVAGNQTLSFAERGLL